MKNFAVITNRLNSDSYGNPNKYARVYEIKKGTMNLLFDMTFSYEDSIQAAKAQLIENKLIPASWAKVANYKLEQQNKARFNDIFLPSGTTREIKKYSDHNR